MFFFRTLVALSVAALSTSCFAEPLPYAALTSLTERELANLIESEILRVQRPISNIRFKASAVNRQCSWGDVSGVGNQLKKGTFYAFQVSRINGSYKLQHLAYDEGSPDILAFGATSNFDNDTGLSKVFGERQNDSQKVFGRIDSKRDGGENLFRAGYYLTGMSDPNGEQFWPTVLDAKRDWRLTLRGKNVVEVQIPYIREGPTGPAGTRTFSFTWGERFYLLTDERSWSGNSNGESDWGSRIITFDNFIEIGNAMLPTLISEVTRTSSMAKRLGENVCMEHRTELSDVSVGSVEKEDLVISFPPGIRVVDAVQGVSFLTGDDGERTNTATYPLVSKLSGQDIAGNVSGKRIAMVLLAISLFFTVIVIRSFKRRPKSISES